jgi:hypothetical protein
MADHLPHSATTGRAIRKYGKVAQASSLAPIRKLDPAHPRPFTILTGKRPSNAMRQAPHPVEKQASHKAQTPEQVSSEPQHAEPDRKQDSGKQDYKQTLIPRGEVSQELTHRGTPLDKAVLDHPVI